MKPTEYSTTPVTPTLKGNKQQFELAGSIVKIQFAILKIDIELLGVFVFSTSVYSAVQI